MNSSTPIQEKNFTDWFQSISPGQKPQMKNFLCFKCGLSNQEFDKCVRGIPPSEQVRNLLTTYTGIKFVFGTKETKQNERKQV